MEVRGYAFPSLLFTGKARRGDIGENVFRDLKLNTLLDPDGAGSEVRAVMSGLPPRGDILKRRELFDEAREMRKNAGGEFTDDPVGALGFRAFMIKEYDRAFARRSGRAKAAVFARLCREFCEFCRTAAETEAKSFFLKRMTEFFREYRKREGYREFEAEAERLNSLIPNDVFAGTYRAGEGLLPGTPERESFFDRVCARISDEEGGDLYEAGADGEGTPDEDISDSFAEALVSLYPEYARETEKFFEKYRGMYDPSVTVYDAEIDFIHGVLRIEEEAAAAGIPTCEPLLTDKRAITAKNAYDITLLEKGETKIIPNDLELTEECPFFFLSGANGGGKTTYLRAVGVNALLALSGARAAADSFEIGPVDGIFTHFPQDENFHGTGRFENEERRAGDILQRCVGLPLVLLNETFSTTNELKSRRATEDLASRLLRKGAFGVYVTHTAGVEVPGTGSLVCKTDEKDGGRRTYKIVRAVNTEGARAADLIEKYRLTPDELCKRFAAREGEG